MSERIPHAGVRVPPPLLFVAGVTAGWLLDRYWHAIPLSVARRSIVEWIGLVLVVAGFALMYWGTFTFRRHRTAIIPRRPASRLVTSGPYRFTRNPMYTGFTIAYLGAAGLLDSAWPLFLLPIVLASLIRFVIRREESYLADAFGAEYAAYCARVRRWI